MKSNYVNERFLLKKKISEFKEGFTERFFSEDPLFVGFSVFFDMSSPLFSPASNSYNESAERFFINQDDTLRTKYTVELRDRVNALMSDHQHFFQSIAGLNQFHLRTEGEIKELVEITTLESLDFRITKILDLYDKITYDHEMKKEVLPDNLKRFTVHITVGDFRKIARWIGGELVDVTSALDTLKYSLKNTTFFTEDGYAFIETIENGMAEQIMSTNMIKFKGGVSNIQNSRIALVDFLKINDNSDVNIRPNVRTANSNEFFFNTDKSEVENKSLLKGITDKAVASATNRALRAVNEFADQKIAEAKNSLGLNDSNSLFNRLRNGADIFDTLKGALTPDGGYSELPKILNPDLSDKIINDEHLDFQDQAQLYLELVKAMLAS